MARCKVCGGEPAGPCYGSIACKSCKAFFVRVCVIRRFVKPCTKFGVCNETQFRGKGRCCPCRYKKCIEVGMIPEITARRIDCKLRQTHPSAEQGNLHHQLMPISKCHLRLNTKETKIAADLASAPFCRGFSADVMQRTQIMVNLEKFTLADDSAELNFVFKYDLNISVRDLVRNPLSLCDRVPIGMHPSVFLPEEPNDINKFGIRVIVRSMLYVADWCKAIPEFMEIDVSEQVSIFYQCYLPVRYVAQFYYSYKHKYDGFLFPLGTKVSLETLIKYQEFQKVLKCLLKFGINQIIPVFKTWKLDDTKFILLKTIMLFSFTLNCSDKTREICTRSFNKYSTALFQIILSESKSFKEAVLQMTDLMEVLRGVQVYITLNNLEFQKNFS